jgi:radical SAM-linked protein
VFFEKGERVRFISHHDLMRALQRALRRARLPVKHSEGFNPRPRLVLPHPIEVGIPSRHEVAEVEMDEWVQPNEFARRLSAACPPGLQVLDVKLAPPGRRAVRVLEAHYEAELGEDEVPRAVEGAREFMAASTRVYERVDHDGRRRLIDLRAGCPECSVRGTRLRMRLLVGTPGVPRPREVLASVLGVEVADVLDARVEKTATVTAEPA